MIGIASYIAIPNPSLFFILIPFSLMYFLRKSIYLFFLIGLAIGFTRITHRINVLRYEKPQFTHFNGKIEKAHKSKNGYSSLIKLNDTQKYIRVKINDEYISELNFKKGSNISGNIKLYDVPSPCLSEAKDIRYREYFSQIISYGNAYNISIIPQSNSFFQDKIESSIKDNFHHPESTIFQTILLGKSSEIPYEIKESFQNSSISHLLAISGLHIGMIMLFFYAIIRWAIYFCVYRLYIMPIVSISKIFAICGAILYLSLIEISISSIRSIIMAIFPIISYFSHRKTVSSHGLMSSIFILLSIWPESLLYPSFQFSCAAVFGLISFKSNFKNYFAQIAFSTLICSIITLPLTIYWFNQAPIQPFLANMICIPIMFIIMSLTVLWLLLFKFGMSFLILNKSISLLISLLIYLSRIFSNLLNSVLLFHQISWISTSLCMISFLIMTNEKYRKISLILFIPFVIEIFNKPNNMFVISRSGEVAILQDGILHAKEENFTTNCWAKTLGAKLSIDNMVKSSVKFTYKRDRRNNRRIHSIKLNNGHGYTLSKQDLNDCPCKIKLF
ncbi:ComEC/Rec2 family competence protein [Candidatus Cytomitobacter indipagum]|nr:ComEC/Rec2 family competence protein [Candidatus Cytomitobacter indipagum]